MVRIGVRIMTTVGVKIRMIATGFGVCVRARINVGAKIGFGIGVA